MTSPCRHVFCLLIALGAWGATPALLAAADADFYVATDGNDQWSGTLPAPNAQRTDGPFATLPRARDAIRGLRAIGSQESNVVFAKSEPGRVGPERPGRHAPARKNEHDITFLRPNKGPLERPLVVMVRAGTYFVPEPLVLRPEDSGTETSPVVYQAYPGEKPTISGGRKITEWRDAGKLWTAELPEVKSGKWHFRQLFVDGHRRPRARFPARGTLKVAGLPPRDSGSWMGNLPQSKSEWDKRAFRFKPGDLRKDWTNLEDVEVVVLQFWMEARLRIKHLDEKSHVAVFTGSSWRPLTWSWGYYVDNCFEGLDTPGSWYLDRKKGVLFYHPLPGEDIARIEAVAPVARQLVRLEGDVPGNKPVEHVTLRGLRFAFTNWTLAPEGYMCTQAEIIPPAAIHADGAVGCRIEQCELEHLGAWGIELRRGCRDNAVVRNLMRDLGAGCVKIGEPNNCQRDAEETCRTLVSDNRMLDSGHVYLGSAGVWIGQSSGNTVSHNEIAGPLMWAVSAGWTWSYFPLQRARDNVIEQNHAHHIGTGILGSHCAIYALGTSPGTVIRNNYIHHVYHSEAWRGAGEGIILDNGCCGILVENNVVHDAVAGGFGTNFNCFGNIIVNNIFAYGTEYQLTVYGDQPSGPPQPKGEVFARNILLWKEGPLIKEADWPSFATLWDYNLYWREGGGPVTFMKHTFEQWQAKGLGRHSVVADPKFVDPAKRDFSLKPDSPALGLGFKPIDLSGVGPRNPP